MTSNYRDKLENEESFNDDERYDLIVDLIAVISEQPDKFKDLPDAIDDLIETIQGLLEVLDDEQLKQFRNERI